MIKYIKRGILEFSLIIASIILVGCRNKSGLDDKIRNQNPAYSAFQNDVKQPWHLGYNEDLFNLREKAKPKTLEDKCPEQAEQSLPKPQLSPYERFKQEKLGERYVSLSNENKEFFDKVYGPNDWKLLDRIFDNPQGFIEELSIGLNSVHYRDRYLKFRETKMKNLDEDLKGEISEIIPIINFNKPNEFDIATAFYFIELRKALRGDDLGIK